MQEYLVARYVEDGVIILGRILFHKYPKQRWHFVQERAWLHYRYTGCAEGLWRTYSQSATGCCHAFQHMHCLICTLPTQHPQANDDSSSGGRRELVGWPAPQYTHACIVSGHQMCVDRKSVIRVSLRS